MNEGTILLSGISGFLGSYVAKKLVDEGYRIFGLIRPQSNLWRIKDIKSKISFLTEDDLFSVHNNYQVDSIIHCATSYGKNSTSYLDIINTNVNLPIKLYEYGKKTGAKIFINTDSFFSREFVNYDNMGAYILSKRQLNDWLKILANDEMKVIRITLEHLYGPKDNHHKFVPWLIEELKGRVNKIELTEGSQLRDFIYINDALSAYMLILQKYKEFPAFCNFDLGSGIKYSLRDFCLTTQQVYQKLTGKKSGSLKFGAKKTKKSEIMDTHPKWDPLKKLGWNSKYTLHEGLKETLKGHI